MAEPTLEGLPNELKILILFQVHNIDSLKSIVFSSPAFHQAYLVVRHELLDSHVKQQFFGYLSLAEALTAIRSKSVHYTFQRENAIALLDRWRRRDEICESSQSPSNQLNQPDGLEEIIKLLNFRKMLSFFIEDFSHNPPRPPWIEPVKWRNNYLPLQLSPLEQYRFLRAICRLQIMKNIFGDPIRCFNNPSCDSCGHGKVWQFGDAEDKSIDRPRSQGKRPIMQNAYRLFYGTMPPWEYEEMGSVLGYLTDKITVISEEIADDLRKLCKATPCKYFSDVLPKEQRPPAPCEIESERDLIHFDDHFDGLAGLGPEFLYRILHTDRISRRNIICQNTRAFWAGPFIGLRIESLWEDRFPFIEPADLHETTYFEQLWSTLPPLEKPSVGWMKAWLVGYGPGNSLEESIDYDRQAETDWEWSYAIWDERRLEGWKAPFLSQDSQVEEPPSRVFYTTEYGEAVEGTSGRILL